MSEASSPENYERIISNVDSEIKTKTNKEYWESLVFPDNVPLLASNKPEIRAIHKASDDAWKSVYNYKDLLKYSNLLKKDAKARRELKKLKANLLKKDAEARRELKKLKDNLSKKKKKKLKNKGVKLKDVISKKDKERLKKKGVKFKDVISKKERKKIIKKIIGIRIIGSWNRSMWQACDVTHQAPTEFHDMLVQMGKLKDFPGKEVKYANKFNKSLEIYNKNKEEIDNRFKACGSKSFREKQRSIMQRMIYILENQTPSQIEIGHDLRKIILRYWVNVYTSKLYIDSNAKHEGVLPNMQALAFFFAFYYELGIIHDDVIEKQNQGEKAKMKIPNDMRMPLIRGVKKQAEQWDKQIKKENKKSQENNKKKRKKKHKKKK